MHEPKIVDQIAEMLGVDGWKIGSKPLTPLRQIRAKVFKEQWCDLGFDSSAEIMERWPWVQEILDEDEEAKQKWSEFCNEWSQRCKGAARKSPRRKSGSRVC
jgi:hypothetical protein